MFRVDHHPRPPFLPQICIVVGFLFVCLSSYLFLLYVYNLSSPAIERSDKNMGGLKRDQRQTAASREPQTHRDGMFSIVSLFFLELFQIGRTQKLTVVAFFFFPANGAVQGCRAGNKNKSLLKRRPRPRSEGGSSPAGERGNGTVANGKIYSVSDFTVARTDCKNESDHTNE